MITLDEYQEEAAETAIYPQHYSIVYPALGLAGEAGEVADKVKKVIRDKEGEFGLDDRQEIAKELGDVLWYVANLAADIEYSLEEIAVMNLDKLNSRKARGALRGSGDNR